MNKKTHSVQRRSMVAGLAVVAGIAVLFAALGGSTARSATKVASAPTGTLVRADVADVTDTDPATDPGSAADWQMYQLVYDRLLDLNGHLQLVPDLATSWKQVSPVTYVFNIRPGVHFSNGREMTVSDVTGSLDRLINPKNSNSWTAKAGPVRSIRATGPWQVTITLKAPHSAFLAALANAGAPILPMKELNAGTFNPAKERLGTGPFEVVSHSQNQSWVLAANPHYWRTGYPKVAKLILRIMPNDAARLAGLRSGAVDIVAFDNPDALILLKGDSNIRVITQASTNIYYLNLDNSQYSIFQNQQLREAVALSLNRNEIISEALGGIGKPTAAVSPYFGNICPASAMPYGTQNITQAKQLVSAAGATGKSVSIIASNFDTTYPGIAQVIQKGLQAIGFNAQVLTLDVGEAVKREFSGFPLNFDMAVNWYAGYSDPTTILANWDSVLSPWEKAYSPSTPAMNAAIVKAGGLPPGKARNAAILAACKAISQAANVIPLVSRSNAYIAYRKDLVHANILPVEGNSIPFRDIWQYTLVK